MDRKLKFLQYYLYIFGFFNVFVVTTVPFIFSDLMWSPRNLPYELMISSIFLVMGIVMIVIAKQPENHKSLVDFIMASSILHAVVMLIFAQNTFQIVFDVIPVAVLGILPLFFYPWGLNKFLFGKQEI